jgi:SAM-dependent methyltransferase
MPFKDKAFDFVVAFHVLEHIADPAAFLSELQRVARAGYIETPNILFERLVPYDVHVLEVAAIGNELIINKKASSRPDPTLNELRLIEKCGLWRRHFYSHPELFHVRYFWRDEIRFRIINPEQECNWFVTESFLPDEASPQANDTNPVFDLRRWGLGALRRWSVLVKRTHLELLGLLACPACRRELSVGGEDLICQGCSTRYPVRGTVIDFLSQ